MSWRVQQRRADGTKFWYCEYPGCTSECDADYHYCKYHKCPMPIPDLGPDIDPHCGNVRSENPVGQLFTLCKKHRCREKTCAAPAALASNSQYCKAHTCNATTFCREGCERTATNQLSRYCGFHKCMRVDCVELRDTTLNPKPMDPTQYRPTARAWATAIAGTARGMRAASTTAWRGRSRRDPAPVWGIAPIMRPHGLTWTWRTS
ncbi:hypothetical protein PG994_013958 [Apiospora phragmitis]|uniref:Uncharacterized protein n=1 Tax=Apiospora phragmitis TaxID=2905665 RepID=A0ABR1T2Y3_9PEZI